MNPEAPIRPLNSPSPIQVRTDAEGRPVEVWFGRGGGGTKGRAGTRPERVSAIREVWRIDDEWWRRPISRLYHEVILENGKLLTLYLDLVEGGWWEQ